MLELTSFVCAVPVDTWKVMMYSEILGPFSLAPSPPAPHSLTKSALSEFRQSRPSDLGPISPR